MSLRLTATAKQELQDAIDWYLEQEAWQAAERFEIAFERAAYLLQAFPQLGTPAFDGQRVWPLTDWPYSLIYRPEVDGILIVAVAHQRRAPTYWAGRD